MEELGLLQALHECPALWSLFSGGPPAPLDAKTLKKLFKVIYSVAGSSKRHLEERTVAFFWDWLAAVEGMSHFGYCILKVLLKN